MSQSDKLSTGLKSTAKSNRSAGGKKPIIKAVRERGYSKRKAAKLVNTVIDVMKKALVKQGKVACPIGMLSSKEYKGTIAKIPQNIRDINSGDFKTVESSRAGDRRVVQLHRDPGIDVTTPEERQAEQEATRRISCLGPASTTSC